MLEPLKKEAGETKRNSAFISKILFLILLALSAIHFYWAFGGSQGFNNALPETEEGVKVLNPTFTDSFIVGFGLLIFSVAYLLYKKTFKAKVLTILKVILFWLIPSIFLLRAIGDFYFVGFFKKIENTNFAHFDNYFYSPLCFIISLLGFVFIINNRRATH